jgi:hypothetical protein
VVGDESVRARRAAAEERDRVIGAAAARHLKLDLTRIDRVEGEF